MLFGLLRRIWILGVLFIGLAAVVSSADVVPLGFDAASFKADFNAMANKGRLVVVLSPT